MHGDANELPDERPVIRDASAVAKMLISASDCVFMYMMSVSHAVYYIMMMYMPHVHSIGGQLNSIKVFQCKFQVCFEINCDVHLW